MSSTSKPYNELDQERIWVAESQKNIAGFKPLYNKYYDQLFRFFYRRTDDEYLSEELCANTFFKALDSINQFKWKGKPFGAWLFKIASNELRKYFRDKKPIYIIEEDKLDCWTEWQNLEQTDYMVQLVKLLDDLPEVELRLLELKYFEQSSFKEMSALLGMSESAVKMRTYRLLSKLKNLLIPNYDQA